MTDYNQRIIDHYADKSIDELHDMLDASREAIRKADAVYMRHGLRSDKDAVETASIRFYNLQMVIRHRGNHETKSSR